jgi:hypothetical protein
MATRGWGTLGVAAFLAVAALTAGLPWPQRWKDRGAAVRLPVAYAQSSAPCNLVSCQQNDTSSASWVVSFPRSSSTSNPYLTAAGFTLYVPYFESPACVPDLCLTRPCRSCPPPFNSFGRQLTPSFSSSCTDAACVAAHPPFLLPSGGVTVATTNNASQGVLGQVTRTDGLQQVTALRSLFGSPSQIPLYFCAADQRPGDRECADQEDQWGFWLPYRP